MDAIRIIPLVNDQPEAWPCMFVALERASLFCQKYDSDSSPEVLRQAIMEHFVAMEAHQAIRVLVAIRENEVVGHLVASLDAWCGKRYLTIVQYELDVPIPRPQLQDALDQIAWWGRQKGASVMRVLARTDDRGPARRRAFQAFYGFTPKRLVMDRDL